MQLFSGDVSGRFEAVLDLQTFFAINRAIYIYIAKSPTLFIGITPHACTIAVGGKTTWPEKHAYCV